MNKPSIASIYEINVNCFSFLTPFTILKRGKGETFNRLYSQSDSRIYIFSKTKEDVEKNLKKLKRAALKFCSKCRKNTKAQFEKALDFDYSTIKIVDENKHD